jgi:hypothetical protein
MNQENWAEYRELQTAGWDVSKTNQMAYNGGSESEHHAAVKMLVGLAEKEAGYRVTGECTHPERGEIDCLIWGNPDRLTLAIEVESNPDEDVIEDKFDRYVDGTPIDDMIPLNLENMHPNVNHCYGYINEVLGFGR